MKTIAMLGIVVAALVGGCALTVDEEPADEAGADALTKNLKTKSIAETDPFPAPIGSTVRVTSKADIADRTVRIAGLQGSARAIHQEPQRHDSSGHGRDRPVLPAQPAAYRVVDWRAWRVVPHPDHDEAPEHPRMRVDRRRHGRCHAAEEVARSRGTAASTRSAASKTGGCQKRPQLP